MNTLRKTLGMLISLGGLALLSQHLGALLH